jgi:hypothetical protein
MGVGRSTRRSGLPNSFRLDPARSVFGSESLSKTPKSTIVAFKVEESLAEFLDKLPNKSEFIRQAIQSKLGMTCPLCLGHGSVSKETHDRFEAFLNKWELHHCSCCGDEFALPRDVGEAAGALRLQMEEIRKSGNDVCITCMEPGHTHS